MTKDIELKAANQGTALATGALALCRTANRLGARSKRRSGVRRPRALERRPHASGGLSVRLSLPLSFHLSAIEAHRCLG